MSKSEWKTAVITTITCEIFDLCVASKEIFNARFCTGMMQLFHGKRLFEHLLTKQHSVAKPIIPLDKTFTMENI